MYVTERIGMGIRGACGDVDTILVGEWNWPESCDLRFVVRAFLRGPLGRSNGASGFVLCECVRSV